MAMRDETRRNLNRALWRDRLKKVGIGAAIVAGIGLFMFYESFDLAVTKTQVEGTIDSIDPLVVKSNSSEEGLTLGVKLDGGGHAQVLAYKSRNPKVGERITIIEKRHGTGRVTFSLK